jgi:hypothetical protein
LLEKTYLVADRIGEDGLAYEARAQLYQFSPKNIRNAGRSISIKIQLPCQCASAPQQFLNNSHVLIVGLQLLFVFTGKEEWQNDNALASNCFRARDLR